MTYVPGMIALAIGIITLILALFKTDPMEKAKALKSSLVTIAIGVGIIIVFSTGLLKRNQPNAPQPAPVTDSQTPPTP